MLCVWWVAGTALSAVVARAQAPRPLCPPDAARAATCHAGYQARQTSFFTVKGVTVMYGFTEGGSFDLKCPPGIALDDPALPRFRPALHARRVFIECPPPPSSYAAALHVLNVTSLDALVPGPSEALPPAPTYLIKLNLNNITNFDPHVLATMPTLRNLSIYDTLVTAADLALLPVGLERLELRHTRVGLVPAAAFVRLPRLVKLTVNDRVPVTVEVAGDLRSLYVSSPAALVSRSLPPALNTLTLWGWSPRHPGPWRSCAALRTLHVMSAAAEELPAGWLARCTRLHTLWMRNAKNLTSLAAGALRGATALEVVWFVSCSLEAVPAGLFDDTPALRELNLSHNLLHTLPEDLFRRSTSLAELYLSYNYLSSSALGALEHAVTLSELHLNDNDALDACPLARQTDHITKHGLSPLCHLRNLTVLTLRGTGTRRACSDWHRLPRLRQLDLARTPITRLTAADLQFNSSVDIKLDLYRTNVTRLVLSREDYWSGAARAGPTLTILLSEPLRCDCYLYWAAATLRRPGTRLREIGARCEDQRRLHDVPLEELVCNTPAACPAGCVCTTRDDLAAPGPLLQLHCAGAGLLTVPHLDARAALRYTGAEPVELDLRLANNHINRLGPEELPFTLAALDLRNNSLSLIDNATAAALVSRVDRRVLLAGNPFECGCGAGAVLATTVRVHPDVFRDWADTTCYDGTPLALTKALLCDDEDTGLPKNVTTRSEGMPAGAIAALVLFAATVVTLGLVMTRHAPRLLRRLLGVPPVRPPSILRLERRRPEPDEWAYDAFVSFAHADEAMVRELVERLEGGAASHYGSNRIFWFKI